MATIPTRVHSPQLEAAVLSATAAPGTPEDELVPDEEVTVSHDSSTIHNDSTHFPKEPQQPQQIYRKPLNPCWTFLTEDLLIPLIRRVVVALSSLAARYPERCLLLIGLFSTSILGLGFLTNFTVEMDHDVILTPSNSVPVRHAKWIREESGFPNVRPWFVLVHSRGDNVLTANAVRGLMQAVNLVVQTPGYDQVCPTKCSISSVTQFWNNNLTLLQQALDNTTTIDQQDEYIRRVLSQSTFPQNTGGGPVFLDALVGNYQTTNATEAGTMEGYNASTTTAQTAVTDMNATTTTTNITSPFQLPTSLQPNKILTSAQSLVVKIDLPYVPEVSDALQAQLLQRLGQLQDDWEAASSHPPIALEYFTMSAYNGEMTRAVMADVALVVLVFFIMIAFCCLVFYRHNDKLNSRGLVGLYAIVTITMSMMTGYGIMFCAGVPFTNIGMMVPFVVIGVGLDDTFVICGAYFRRCGTRRSNSEHAPPTSAGEKTQPSQQLRQTNEERVIARIRDTMEEVGLSITLTTVTTILAFFLGGLSSIPAIRWLCYYALTTIFVDFIYQITFFIALLALDERRIQARRRDVCFWITVEEEKEEHDVNDGEENAGKENKESLHQNVAENSGDTHNITKAASQTSETSSTASSFDLATVENPNKNHSNPTTSQEKSGSHVSERFMEWYADQLFKPWVQAVVILSSLTYFGGCIYSTTLMTQQFLVPDYVPKNSFVASYFSAMEAYTSLVAPIGVYFRDVDQADPVIQHQMLDYVKELSDMPQINEGPPTFWVRDFAAMGQSEMAQEMSVGNMTFSQQLDLAFSMPQVQQVFGGDIVRDPDTGDITASRTWLFLRNVDLNDVNDQIDMLLDQRTLTMAQPINSPENTAAHGGDLSFFTFEDVYFYWELYSVSEHELIMNTISGVVAVSVVAFILIPHWSAMVFVIPLMMMLYINLLGTLQICGIHINPITYVLLVISIGLLVDFLMHILLRYYETTGTTRHAKVKETLVSMGSSILLGGLSTMLGVLPLAFSSTKIFISVFICFFAMVSLGCGMGLILLPVVLSLIGPLISSNEPQLQTHPDIMSTSTASAEDSPQCYSFDRYHTTAVEEVEA